MLYPAFSAVPPLTDRKSKYITPSCKGALMFGKDKEIENICDIHCWLSIHDIFHVDVQ